MLLWDWKLSAKGGPWDTHRSAGLPVERSLLGGYQSQALPSSMRKGQEMMGSLQREPTRLAFAPALAAEAPQLHRATEAGWERLVILSRIPQWLLGRRATG